jgi:hypothetical protein
MNHGWRLFAVVAVAVIADGCATKEIYLPDGQKGHVINCSSHGRAAWLIGVHAISTLALYAAPEDIQCYIAPMSLVFLPA